MRVIAQLNHNWGSWVVTTPATCDADGEEKRTCTLCGDTETSPIAQLSGIPSGCHFNSAITYGSFTVTSGGKSQSYRVGNYGSWWSSTESDVGNAYDRYINYNYDYMGEYDDYKSDGFSVRCIMN